MKTLALLLAFSLSAHAEVYVCSSGTKLAPDQSVDAIFVEVSNSQVIRIVTRKSNSVYSEDSVFFGEPCFAGWENTVGYSMASNCQQTMNQVTVSGNMIQKIDLAVSCSKIPYTMKSIELVVAQSGPLGWMQTRALDSEAHPSILNTLAISNCILKN